MNPQKLSRKEENVFLGIERSYSWSNRLEHALSCITINKNSRILDIGAGKLAEYGKKRFGNNYSCIDHGDSYTIPKTKSNILDKKCNFERESLPYENQEFDVVICLDVLEHLDNPHKMLSEIFRISSKKVVVSLPNNWVGFIKSLLIGRNISHRAGYGIYSEPHPNGQRHKYWFNYSEARDFLLFQTPENYIIEDVIPRFGIMEDSFLPGIMPRCINKKVKDYLYCCSSLIYSKEIRDERMKNNRYLIKAILGIPFFFLEYFLTRLLYGTRSKLNWFNMVCRGIVVTYQRKID
tara:strand:+ start:281 stop:1159 length:879 start_codon:yes stop_codon:yes gene_type:complete